MSGDAFGEMPDRMLGQARHHIPFHRRLAEPFNPDFSGTIGANFDDLIVLKPTPDRARAPDQ
ncbi:hypothetical protein [Bradyrhizobium iriomotense]|uniref:Uncharacterized protein n=1 Tax=Bradyrhizobium iriomotense TaxID=441950 RepID=A0ABQ6B9S7_9BRAD|nr:hypothetical protein [Bradyrhizobium iriomotense]GLR89695.1 hypothetical protein GCM10007857_64090 [Bradyrhizobium iriomotense]